MRKIEQQSKWHKYDSKVNNGINRSDAQQTFKKM